MGKSLPRRPRADAEVTAAAEITARDIDAAVAKWRGVVPTPGDALLDAVAEREGA
jgi:hypothetical protein